MASRNVALSTTDIVSLIASASSGSRVSRCVRSSAERIVAVTGSDVSIAMATLLSRSVERYTPVVAAETEAGMKRAKRVFEQNSVNAVYVDAAHNMDATARIRSIAHEAISRDSRAIVLPSTKVDAAISGLTELTGSLQPVNDYVPEAEMLPPGVLNVVRPLISVPPDVTDATVAHVFGDVQESNLEAETDNLGLMSEVRRAQEQVGVDLDQAIRHGNMRYALACDMTLAADGLMRECLIDINHWGYAVICRKTLARAYNDPYGGGQNLALDVLARFVMHVSGYERKLTHSNQNIQSVARELLSEGTRSWAGSAGRNSINGRISVKSAPADFPKGRTVSGVLLRPSTGSASMKFDVMCRRRKGQRASPSLLSSDASESSDLHRTRWSSNFRGAGMRQSRAARTDFIVITREPDSESSALRATRMGGMPSCSPIPHHGGGTYWDNRYVVFAVPAATIEPDAPIVSDKDVLLTALSARRGEFDKQLWTDASFYVRQMRHIDWERMTTVSKRVRWFNVPYQCTRGLPVVLQKSRGEIKPGVLAAAPHLGLSGRSDMVFTAVRLPRYRCLPAEIDPGFMVLANFAGINDRSQRGEHTQMASE